ncbi:DUF6653 family protein [Actinomycetes bacterium KLBMP 9759]
MGATRMVTGVFGMSEEVWRRHAHPWSVYTRFAAIPPLVVAIWSRVWIGWWALAAVAVVVVWLWLNPRAFPPVTTPAAWASKGIAGERIWADERDRVPEHHREAFRLIAVPGVVGIAMLVWGLVRLEVWPTCTGAALVVLAQLWRIDRLAWMYDELRVTG